MKNFPAPQLISTLEKIRKRNSILPDISKISHPSKIPEFEDSLSNKPDSDEISEVENSLGGLNPQGLSHFEEIKKENFIKTQMTEEIFNTNDPDFESITKPLENKYMEKGRIEEDSLEEISAAMAKMEFD
eukprot:CAMPEP_0205814436 /NCGR_PEP_ID=MMETSP0205-20121125/19574_1 /ASSEMBLY_ACC=CAM_ASM_000278 /TAXON_ID=36767 /ORGANISM="Euplotes focardii, Strain TN1" /LENGTH=129 /DNA_ID=CAMNT_0053098481 /DNA_START=105 /DNA_END=491 /DNA_ORIENTATION=+